MQTIDEALAKLERSGFRSRFRLTESDVRYCHEKGIDVIREHAETLVKTKLAPADPVNDGKQTPMKGHPVFKAMHATACCCRVCLEKWYKVERHRPLTDDEQTRIVNLIMTWITKRI